MNDTPIHSPSWFEKAFAAKTPVPLSLRQASTKLCKKFDIKGSCDPLYIANTMAVELGVGNGHSEFVPGPVHASSEQITNLVDRLKHAYSTCIQGNLDDVSAILKESFSGMGPLPADYPEIAI